MLAADSRTTKGDIVSGGISKIARREDGTLVGACGTCAFMQSFIDWVLSGEPAEGPKIKPRTDGDSCDVGIIIRANGNVEHHEYEGSYVVDAPFHAWGSGYAIALGAMAAGADAEAAVRIATEYDIYSGGAPTVLRL